MNSGTRLKLVLFVLGVASLPLFLFVLGCSNPLPINRVTMNNEPSPFGTITVTVEVQRPGGPGGDSLEGYPIGVIFKPRDFVIQNDALYFIREYEPTPRKMSRVTAGPAIDGWELAKRKLRVLAPSIMALESKGYTWWVGAGIHPNMVTLEAGEKLVIIGTFENTGFSTVTPVFFFDGMTTSSIESSAFVGTSNVYVINGTSVSGGGLVGLASIIGGSLAVSDSGRIFVASQGINFSAADPKWGMLFPTNTVTILNPDGTYRDTIVIPHTPPEGSDYAVKAIAFARNDNLSPNRRLYAACTPGLGGSNDGGIRIYDDNGTEIGVYDRDALGNLGVSSNSKILGVRTIGSTNEVYFLNGNSDHVVILRDSSSGRTHEAVEVPGGTADSLILLGNGGFAVTALNQVFLYDSSGALVDVATPEGTTVGCDPVYALDDPVNKKLYVAQSISLGISTGGGQHIWEVSYEAAPASVQVYDMGAMPGYFAIDSANKRLYVPMISSEVANDRIDTITLADGIIHQTIISGYPLSVAVPSDSKVYVAAVDFVPMADLMRALIMPPEMAGNRVRIYTWNGSDVVPDTGVASVEVGYFPSGLVADGANVIALCGFYPSVYFDLYELDIPPPGGSPKIRAGYPLIFPSVFKPASGKAGENVLTIAYELSVDASVTIVVTDISGRNVYTRQFRSGTQGGKAGYNQVLWNGKTDFGKTVGNGIYPYKIISKGKVIGKGHVVVYD